MSLDAAATTRCRRRVHLDHDPAAVAAPRALPDPALEQRRADAAAHRERIAAQLAEAAGSDWCTVPSELPVGERAAVTAAAVAAGAPLIWRGALPTHGARDTPGGPAVGRRGSAELLVRRPEGGYLPVIVVHHRITDPGSGAHTTPLPEVALHRAAPDPERRVRSHARDLLRLAHLHRMLRAASWAPAEEAVCAGGVIGLDADVVVWHDLAAEHWPGGRSTIDEYDLRFADRAAVAVAARSGGPALAAPSRINECRRCPWWPTCEAELSRAQDVSLVARGEPAAALRDLGVRSIRDLAQIDPATPPGPVPGPPLGDLVALARAWLRGLAVVRRVERVPVPRADVEVDVDMESFGESGAYLWGALLRHPGGRRDGDEEDGYRAFATWEPLPTQDEARSFAEFWAWFREVRRRAHASGRTFAAYCYNADAENRWLLGSARRFAGLPGVPAVAEIEEFIGSPAWVDVFALVSEWFLCAHGKGLKVVAPVAGFAWRDAEAGGENSMRWYRDAVGADGAPPDPGQRQRLLDYNADDVAATLALREWMCSPAVEAVPLAAQL
ncbi:MAG: TM0106 family RecB-like putative nuclease [Pseudonocardia sp.]